MWPVWGEGEGGEKGCKTFHKKRGGEASDARSAIKKNPELAFMVYWKDHKKQVSTGICYN